jgi:GntR family transcriptional repressor for pyruvate dehydrogenase complex
MGINRAPLSEGVSDKVIEMIAAGEFAVDDPLPSEAQLAELFGVSKPVIREALKQLSMFGLVEIRQGRVAKVRALNSSALEGFFRLAIRSDGNGLRDAIDLRRAVEVELAELAATRATRQTRRPLEKAFQTMEDNVDSFEQWLEGDFAFHMALADASGNAIMQNTMKGLSGIIRYTQRLLGVQTDLRNARHTLKRHEAILQAVMDGDSEAAGAAMRVHFEAPRSVVSAISADKSRLARI